MDHPDLDTRQHIDAFVERFYQKILVDERLAPLFLDVAGIDLAVHLPHIKNYWCKLLLGEKSYSRHTMNIHRQLNARAALVDADFQRWLSLFISTVEEHYAGEKADRAKALARNIAANMAAALHPAG